MRKGVITLLGLASWAHPVAAQSCGGDPGISLTVSDPSPSIGGPFTLTSQTAVGDFVLLLVGSVDATIDTPYGALCVALPAAIVTFPQITPAVALPATIPFDVGLIGATPHFQFFSQAPGGGVVHRSNAVSVEIDDGSGAAYPIEIIELAGEPGEPILADLDGDGFFDLVTPYVSATPADIRPALGDGSFGSPTAFSDAATHYSVAACDVDGDLDLDLLLSIPSALQIWKNDGQGQFQLFGSAPTPTYAPRFATGDFDLDGDLDAASADSLGSEVFVLNNSGSGALSSTASYVIGPKLRSVVASDTNLDGDLDLGIAHTDFLGGVQILRGIAHSNFVSAGWISTPSAPGFLVTDDLDGDGRFDYVVSSSGSDIVTAWLMTQGFPTLAVLHTGDEPSGLAIADLDADGIRDIAVANTSGISIGLFRGLGAGFYDAMIANPTSPAPSYLTVGDLDEDGRPDLIATLVNTASLAVHLDRNGTGFGLEAVTELTSPTGLRSATLGDFNGDSNQDILGISPQPSKFLRYFGDGAGNFVSAPGLTIGLSQNDIASADFDNDSDLDLVISQQNTVSTNVLLGDGLGNFASSTTAALREGIFAIGDLDGDGIVDFVATGRPTVGSSHQLQGFRSAGDGSFAPWPSVPTITFPTDVALGDLDLDGDLDATVTNSGSPQLQVYLSNGLGVFASASLIPVGNTALAVALDDLDSDGDLDAALAPIGIPQLTLLSGNGLGGFALGPPVPIHAPASDVEFADFNGDQRLDIAAVSTLKSTLWISLAAPGGGFPANDQFRSAPGASQLLIGPVNHDALPDVVTISSSPANSVSVSLHR